METAKEELQSSNEELTTLNEELRSRNADLAHVSNDLTNLLTVINIPIVMVDRGLRIRRFTPAAGTLLNLLPGDLGRPLTDLRLGMPVPDVGQLVGEVIDTLIVVQRDIQVQDHQWYTLSIRPYQTVDNQIDGAVITFVDISPVKGSELRYRQLYEQGFTTTSDAIAQVDVETGYLQEVNPSFLRLLGWPREEVVGKPLWEGPVFHAVAESEEAFRALTRVGYRRFEDLSLPTKEGRAVAVDLVSTLYPAGTKEVVQLRLHDLTERKQAEEALRVANRALVRTNEDLRQFAYAASHDLREPLRQISVYIQLLATTYEGQLDAQARQYLDTCLHGAQRMQLLLHDLLAYVRISEAQGAPPLTDANHVLQQTLEKLQAEIAESGAVITADPLPTLPVHEAHLLQLFQNLLSNAVKYRSKAAPLIHVSATRRAGTWVWSVRDNGIGIEPQYHTRVFGIFTRLHGHEYAGTGMGLAICQKIVERYGGRIGVESALGEGATFYFTLNPAGGEDRPRE
jgi:two-component system CheB/CheR fusion protein